MARTTTIHQQLEVFLAANPPSEYIDALTAFLTAPMPAVDQSTWLPPAVEVEARQDLMRSLRNNIRFVTVESGFEFTSIQTAALCLMPRSTLQAIVSDTSGSFRVSCAVAEQWTNDILRDSVRYFLQGQHPEAKSRKRKTPGREPQPIEAPTGDSPGEAANRNMAEKARCLERDRNACIFTHCAAPEVCHIVPFAFNSNKANIGYTARFSRLLVLFFPEDEVSSRLGLIASGTSCSDFSWNMLSVNPYLHAWWVKPYWGIECIGIVPRLGKHVVQIAFHWMPRSMGDPIRTISLEPGSSSDQHGTMLDDMIDQIREAAAQVPPNGSGGLDDDNNSRAGSGHSNGIQHDTYRPIISGQIFEVELDTADEANKMRVMIDIQWACIRLAAMSGAAGPDDLSDTFSEFDFERDVFQFRQHIASLGASDTDSSG